MNQINEISSALEVTSPFYGFCLYPRPFFSRDEKAAALPTLVLYFICLIAAAVFQQDLLSSMANQPGFMGMYGVLIGALGEGVSIKTSNAVINDLLSRGECHPCSPPCGLFYVRWFLEVLLK